MATLRDRLITLATSSKRSASSIHKALVAEGFSISLATVGRRIGEVRPARKERRFGRKPGPKPKKSKAVLHPSMKPLVLEETNNAAALERVRASDPDVARWLAAGETKVGALLGSAGGSYLYALEGAEDLAEVARAIVDDFGCGFDPDEGQDPLAFAAEMETRGRAEMERTARMLEDAAALVRAKGLNEHWKAT